MKQKFPYSLTVYISFHQYVERHRETECHRWKRLIFCKARSTCLFSELLPPGPVHGYGISLRIRQISREVLNVQQGSLYPALHRLEKRGWLAAEWGDSESGRQAKFYRLSAKGRRQLAQEEANWNRLSEAVRLILATAYEEG